MLALDLRTGRARRRRLMLWKKETKRWARLRKAEKGEQAGHNRQCMSYVVPML